MPDTDLHQDVGELRGEMKALRGEVANLRQDFKEANGAIKDLTAVLNQARGAKAATYAMTALLAGFVSMAGTILTFLGLGLTKGN